MSAKPREAQKGRLVEVAILSRIGKTFTYIVGDELAEMDLSHRRVLVPLGKRLVTGLVLGPGVPVAEVTMKEVRDVLDEEPLVTPELVRLARFVSSYYVAPIGEVLRTMLPPGVNVESFRALEITDLGRAAMGSAPDRLERTLLQLAAKRPRTASSLVRAVPGARHRHLIEMMRCGWLRPAERMRAETRPRTVRVVSITPKGGEVDLEQLASKAPRQAAVLAALSGGEGRLYAADLARAVGPCSPSLRALAEKSLVEMVEEEAPRGPEACRDFFAPPPASLTPGQRAALDLISPALESGAYAAFLLHGVTGSGKTEVYIRLAQRAIELGMSACVIVPEIALTPQLVSRFACRIEVPIAVLHSGLSPSERLTTWRSIMSGKARLAIGARSGLFAPLRGLGLIVVDEEQEPSFKQEEGVPYSARDLALVAAQQAGGKVVLGSATPSLESLHNAERGKLTRIRLDRRVDERPMPRVQLVDLRGRHPDPEGAAPALSDELAAGIEGSLAGGRQAILFINRRGTAAFILCSDCGYIPKCNNCSISLVLHHRRGSLLCHYCNQAQRPPESCPRCGSSEFVLGPPGTQAIAQQVEGLFPDARILRLDRDTVGGRTGHERALSAFARGEFNVMIGTQMVAKGHDFPGVTLVGVLLADHGLALPDFRAAERTFAQLVQVSGRAGRGDDPGLVIFQTYMPDHYAIRLAAGGDTDGFAAEELRLRREAGYPPFSRLAMIRVSSTSAAKAADYSAGLAEIANVSARRTKGWIDVLGPAPALVAKVRGRHRWQVIVRGIGPQPLSAFLGGLLVRAAEAIAITGVRVHCDVDPVNMF